ncbi:MAG: transglycosylase SLT domain-containing protein [Candidatus Woesearchaeota archaeon]
MDKIIYFIAAVVGLVYFLSFRSKKIDTEPDPGTSKNDIRKYVEKFNKEIAFNIAIAIYDYGSRYNIKHSLILAVIEQETDFKPREGNFGEQGIMQVTEIALNEVKRVYSDKVQYINKDDLTDNSKNIKVGTLYLKYCIDRANGNIKKGLAYYNGGFEPPEQSFKYAEEVLDKQEKIKDELRG